VNVLLSVTIHREDHENKGEYVSRHCLSRARPNASFEMGYAMAALRNSNISLPLPSSGGGAEDKSNDHTMDVSGCMHYHNADVGS
jgi:hypothetical protein